MGVRGALRGRGALAVYRQVSSGGRFLLDVRPTGAGGRPMRTFAYGRARRPHGQVRGPRSRGRPRGPRRPERRLGRTALADGGPASLSADRPGGEAPELQPRRAMRPSFHSLSSNPRGPEQTERAFAQAFTWREGRVAAGGVIDAPHTPEENLLEPPTPRWPPPAFSAQLLPSAGPAA